MDAALRQSDQLGALFSNINFRQNNLAKLQAIYMIN